NAVRALWSRVRREAHAEAPRAHFALHAGDLINRPNADAEWAGWHEAAGWLNGSVPTVATPGNHEYEVNLLGPRLSGHWRPQFSLPTNGPEGLEETCYWFDYQGVRFVALNSNERVEEQAQWLDERLGALPRARWTIATFHHPIYSAAKDRDNPRLRGLWKPLFAKHGVDLALQGHDHAYARSGLGGPKDDPASPPVGRENVAAGRRAVTDKTVYVVSVSGPKRYPLTDAWDVERVGTGLQLYQVIGVDRDAIRYRAFRASGELYDAFTLRKNDAGDVKLVEQPPGTPEVRE
ncbi:MAG: metallophosphoesterase, partial [Planctomycetota bacterium]